METLGRIFCIEGLASTRIKKVLSRYGIDRSGLDMLATLRRAGSPYQATPTQLYKALVLTSGAITNRIDSLEREGLVERRAISEDRRSISVALTKKGIQVIDTVMNEHLANEASIVAHLSGAEKRYLAKLLKKILLKMEKEND